MQCKIVCLINHISDCCDVQRNIHPFKFDLTFPLYFEIHRLGARLTEIEFISQSRTCPNCIYFRIVISRFPLNEILTVEYEMRKLHLFARFKKHRIIYHI